MNWPPPGPVSDLCPGPQPYSRQVGEARDGLKDEAIPLEAAILRSTR